MFATGDHVKMRRRSSGYDPGAQGVVLTIPEPNVLQVDIDKDENGNQIQPPDPLPPLPENYFEKV